MFTITVRDYSRPHLLLLRPTSYPLVLKPFKSVSVCKIVALELESRLEETGKVQEVIEIGYSLDDIKPKKKTKYNKS